jgi:AcrR family transcriptional regulator
MLGAAVETFARRGYRAASMDEIAEQAGVSKPLVYLYLNSKEELFTACIQREAAALDTAVRRAVEPGAGPERQLRAGLRAFFTHTAEHPDGWALLYRQARTQGEPFAREVDRLRAGLVAYVTGLVSSAARDGDAVCDAAGIAHALVGAAESLADRANSTAGQKPHDTAATLMNFAWPGLENLLRRG